MKKIVFALSVMLVMLSIPTLTSVKAMSYNYDFFKNVYTITTNYETEQELPIFISNVLTFMGDIKKLKLIFNKKFEEFKDIIAIEGDNKKDANDSIRFFSYALNNNPRNTRVYSNLGYVYREFLEDHMSSAYWFIRALSCIDNDMKQVTATKALYISTDVFGFLAAVF